MSISKCARLKLETNKQTDQTTTLCVQEVEIYLERWEVLGALVVISVGRARTNTNTNTTHINMNSGA